MHCELYPNSREEESQNGLLAELREIIVHASAGQITPIFVYLTLLMSPPRCHHI